MRIIAKLHEHEQAAFLSHLDMQRSLQRSLRRADMPLAYSQGFNPHPLMAFAGALSTGFESDGEYFDVRLTEDVTPRDFEDRLNAVLSPGLFVSNAMQAPEGLSTLTGQLQAARYTLWLTAEGEITPEQMEAALDRVLSASEVTVQKRTKSGAMVPQNLRPQLLQARLLGRDGAAFTLDVLGELTAGGGLRMDALAGVLLDFLGSKGFFRCRREEMYFADVHGLPSLGKGNDE